MEALLQKVIDLAKDLGNEEEGTLISLLDKACLDLGVPESHPAHKRVFYCESIMEGKSVEMTPISSPRERAEKGSGGFNAKKQPPPQKSSQPHNTVVSDVVKALLDNDKWYFADTPHANAFNFTFREGGKGKGQFKTGDGNSGSWSLSSSPLAPGGFKLNLNLSGRPHIANDGGSYEFNTNLLGSDPLFVCCSSPERWHYEVGWKIWTNLFRLPPALPNVSDEKTKSVERELGHSEILSAAFFTDFHGYTFGGPTMEYHFLSDHSFSTLEGDRKGRWSVRKENEAPGGVRCF
jgi:hypothetical protein